MKKKLLWIIVPAAVAAAVMIAVLLSGNKTVLKQGNLLENGDFSLLSDAGMPEGWFTDDYMHTAGYTDYSAEAGMVTIVNHALNDARFAQTVAVQPDSLYCLSGQIRAEAQGGLGANLSVADVYAFSESVYDSGGEWRTVSLYGRTGKNQKQVTVFVRLGGYSGEATGTASFRGISLEQVQSVPADVVALQWYRTDNVPVSASGDDGSPAWPFLLLIACLYAIVCFAFRGAAMERHETLQTGRREWVRVSVMLLICAGIRVVIARLVPGYAVDIGCFTYWGQILADAGAADFYNSAGFCDYPPGYILVLGLLAKVGKILGTGMTEMLVKVPSIICDTAAAAILYAFACRYVSRKAAFVMAALYALNPLTFAAGAAWGQSDSVMALALMLVVVLAMKDCWEAALPLYMLSVLIKPQALMFGPLGLIVCLHTLFRRKDRSLYLRAALGTGLAVLAGLAVVMPFSVNMDNSEGWWLIRLYRGTMGYYDSASVNACNLYFLFGRNWADVSLPAEWYVRLASVLLFAAGIVYAGICGYLKKRGRWALLLLASGVVLVLVAMLLPVSLGTWGTVMIVASVMYCAFCCIRGGDIRHLPLLGAVLLILICNLGVMMHERYMFAAVILLALACVAERDKRVYVLFAVVSAAVFLNVSLVLDRGIRIGGSAGHLEAPMFGISSDSAALEYGISALQCLITAYAGFVAADLCILGRCVGIRVPGTVRECAPLKADNCSWKPEEESGLIQPMKGMDWLLMLSITAVYAVMALTNLGSTDSPQTWWRSVGEGESIVLDLGGIRAANMLYFGGIHNREQEFTVEVSDDGENWSEPYWAQITEGDCFKWKYLTTAMQYDGKRNYSTSPEMLVGRYVRITARDISLTVYEVILRDPETQAVFPVTLHSGAGENLIDEQDAFYGEPGWYNSTYFDEIYHARTGYEHYLAMHGDYTYYPYETSHPPLGKVLIAFSISVFGMTPFGWRFAGALAGVLMLPGMYLLGKMITKRRIGAILAICLMALDFMHFTQTRIATIDSFVVLFIIWSYVFMIRYVRMDYWGTPFVRTLLPLGLSGLFMGLAVASKWTGCYAGVGLALLFFWSLYRRFRQSVYAGTLSDAQPLQGRMLSASDGKWTRPLITLACCLIFFVAVPLLVYYVSYIPYFMPYSPPGVTVKRVVQAAVGDYFETGFKGGMLGYHSTPGLGMDHPFYSPWYQWPVIAKPMWYYAGTYREAGTAQTIVAFGNPVVWWGGLAALLTVLVIWMAGHMEKGPRLILHSRLNDSRPAILLISFAAQFIPWTLVPRGTYIYHYFTCVPFIILCSAFVLDMLFDRVQKPFYVPAFLGKVKTGWDRRFGRLASSETIEDEKTKRSFYLRKLPAVLSVICIAAAGALFVAFFPYISGITASVSWLRAMQWFDGWIYF